MSSQTESRCWVVCCFKAAISMTSMSSTRMLNSYFVARIALNIDHAQLWREDTTAAVQQSSAMSLYIVPAGLPAKLFQNLAARKSQTCCRDFKPSSAKRMSVEVLPLLQCCYVIMGTSGLSWASRDRQSVLYTAPLCTVGLDYRRSLKRKGMLSLTLLLYRSPSVSRCARTIVPCMLHDA